MSIQKTKILLSAITTIACMNPSEINAMGAGGGCITGNIGLSVVSSPLDFADISPSVAAGTVTIAQNTGALTTGGSIAGTSGVSSRARIRVVGGQSSGGIRVFIRVPGTTAINSGGNNMNVTNFLLNNGPGRVTVSLNGNKTTTLDIGATLNVGGGQAGGTYTGTANVTATCT